MRKLSEFNTKILTTEVGQFGMFRAEFVNDQLKQIEYIPEEGSEGNVFRSNDVNFYKAIYGALQELVVLLKPTVDPNVAPNLDLSKELK